MRTSLRAIQPPCYSVVSRQSFIKKIVSVGKKRLGNFVEELINARKEMIETIVTILFAGSLLLGGTYLFLSQLAQHGW